jgi:hypothetical protein
MGKCSETVAANAGGEVNGLGSCKANHVGISTEEDRGGTTGKVGEGEGAAEKGGLERTESSASYLTERNLKARVLSERSCRCTTDSDEHINRR